MNTTADVLGHHLKAFGGGDLDGIMEDYTDESVVFTPNGPFKGTASIRDFFSGLFAEFAKPGASFEMLRQDVEADVAYIVWSAETADNVYELATDTFVMRDGRIAIQTFAGKITPKR